MFFEVLCGGGLVSFALLMAFASRYHLCGSSSLPQERPAFFCDLRVVYCLPPFRIYGGGTRFRPSGDGFLVLRGGVALALQQSFKQAAAISQPLPRPWARKICRQEFCLPPEAV